MLFEEMSIEQLIVYRACVEVYGTPAELNEVCERIAELQKGE